MSEAATPHITDEELSELERLLGEATPGPVAWMGNGQHDIYLATTHSGRIYVMGFKRMGIQGAQPMFPKDGRMAPASDMLKFDVGDPSVTGIAAAKTNGSVYRYDVRDIDNPEARLLVAARNALPRLLAEVKRARAEALEEAAQLADVFLTDRDMPGYGAMLADRIRALKEKPDPLPSRNMKRGKKAMDR
jgi:hypothetical protein